MPHTGEGTAALAAGSERVIARYEAFTLVEATGRDAERLRAAGADERDDMRQVRIGGRGFDPRAERAQIAGKRRAAPRGPGLALVQFAGPVKDAWRERLRGTGVRVVTYVAENGYVVHGGAAQLERLADLLASDPAVRAVTELGGADKLASGAPARGRAAFEVQTLTGAEGSAARRELAARGRELRIDSEVGAFHTQYVEADAAEIRALAADPGVLSVLPYVAPELLDERAAQVVAGNLDSSHAPTAPGYLSWLAARGFAAGTFGFAIDVTDSGIDTSTAPGAHPDFYEGGSTSNPGRISYKRNYTQDAEAWDCNGHGTNVASIAAGYNDASGGTTEEDAEAYNFGLGVAPRARLGSSKIFDCNGAFELNASYAQLAANAYGDGARVSNNSWGAAVGGAYTSDSQAYDAIVRDAQTSVGGNQQIVELFANGNDGPGAGTVGSPGTAKNVISVGAAENVRQVGFTDGCGVSDAEADSARDIVDFSSRGPTDDGRTKPDVVSPGTHVTGAAPQVGAAFTGAGTCDPEYPAGNALYSLVSGTSQATPGASGFAALIRDHYRRTAGGGSAVPSPAMTKAIMVNSATDIAGGVDGGLGTIASVPNSSQGWGRIDAGSAFDATERAHFDQATVLAASGDSFARTFSVPDAGRPVKLTLVWSDPPGPTGGTANYVNNLDLTVTAGGETYKGNVFSNGGSATGGTADVRNNVENVFLPAGTGGPLTVTVTATNVAGDGVPGNGDATDQDFALVASNVTTTPTPALAHVSTTVAETSGNGNGRIEPGEAFRVTERLRNAGDATASGVGGTLSTTTGGVTLTQASSPYPDLAPGAEADNATPYAATLHDTADCGTVVQMSLSVTRSGGSTPTVIPIQVQTGAPADSATTTSSTDVPKSIPDNSAGGVTSTLQLAGPGVLADLDVRIAQITHPYVGDLVLTITAPDGTAVTLASRPGGASNSGDNLTNTIFDDEATAAIGAAGTAAPYTGRHRPASDQLSRLDGKPIAGTWTLRVADVASQDVGSLDGWGLDTTGFECAPATGGAPTAAFDASPNPAQTGQTVAFDASGSSDDGAIARYEWDLDGNGSYETDTGATAAASRSYADDGSVEVGLRVTDDEGMTGQTSKTVTIANRAPSAAFTASPSPAQPGQQVLFDASAADDPDGSLVSFRWDLDGDGSYETDTGTGATATRTYATGGTRTVRLAVTDDDGATATATRSLRVNHRPTAALSASPNPAQVGQPVGFSAAGSSDPDLDGEVVEYRWDLDNAPGYELTTATPTVSRSYASAATFPVRVRVVDDLGGVSDPVERSLEVRAASGGDTGGGGTGGGTGGGDTGGGTGGGDTGGGGTGGGTQPPDTTAPQAALGRLSSRLGDLLRGRWRVAARCDEPCVLGAELYRGRAPRTSQSRSRAVVLARGSGRLAQPGSTRVRLRPTRQGRRLLRGSRRIAATLRVRATDAAGNVRVVDRRLTLRR